MIIVKKFLLRLHWIFCQFGLDFLKFIKSFRGLTRFIMDYFSYRFNSNEKIIIKPCINDYYEESGEVNSEYFLQDLFLAQMIFKDNPQTHIDIGSRIDGFVAHVASFRKIDVMDIRPIYRRIENVNFIQADLMNSNFQFNCKYHSLSCLHTIEHFGLGRYGDTIDPSGYLLGIENITKLLCTNGKFYLSTPIGKERVEFNANRVFNPVKLITIICSYGFTIKEFYTISAGNILTKQNINQFSHLENEDYNLGMFIFEKNEL